MFYVFHYVLIHLVPDATLVGQDTWVLQLSHMCHFHLLQIVLIIYYQSYKDGHL